jgi:hypothetical protein
MVKMELNINSPKYYKDVYGVDDEIYRLCQDIYIYFKDKSYSEIINIIGIIPIIAPKELLENGKYKEVKHCSVAYGFADVNLFMDYEKYVEACMDEKKSMIVKNVVDSVKAIKTKGKIDFNHFKEDMMSFCEVSGINYY